MCMENVPIYSGLYIPEPRTMVSRGRSNYFKHLGTFTSKSSRQGPALQCSSIASKVLSLTNSTCRLCKSSVFIQHDDIVSSDNLLASALHSSDSLASPSFINFYLTCLSRISFTNFLPDHLHKRNIVDLTLEIFESSGTFDWLCPEHISSFKPVLLKCMAEFILNYVCKATNRDLRDAQKKKNLQNRVSAARAQKNSPQNLSEDPDDPDWVDITEEEAEAFERLLCDSGNLHSSLIPICSIFFHWFSPSLG